MLIATPSFPDPSITPSPLMVMHQTLDLGSNLIEVVWRDTLPVAAHDRAFARIEARLKP